MCRLWSLTPAVLRDMQLLSHTCTRLHTHAHVGAHCGYWSGGARSIRTAGIGLGYFWTLGPVTMLQSPQYHLSPPIVDA